MANINSLPSEITECMIVSQFDLSKIISPFKASVFFVAEQQESPVDLHEVRELWYILEGSGELTYNTDKKIMLNESDMFYFDKNISHSIKNNSSRTLKVFSIWW